MTLSAQWLSIDRTRCHNLEPKKRCQQLVLLLALQAVPLPALVQALALFALRKAEKVGISSVSASFGTFSQISEHIRCH
ncbi:hypothetical protein V5799_027170 [Amblyomma americanum]|uniref:Uncharacterized protein n=1 Tax=Amblyomma americanum TaxID=6943 RepID=A0AAQ4DGH3_AMBAM